jgi:hypothetical protein
MEGKSGKHVGGEKYSTESGGRSRCSEACSRILSMPKLLGFQQFRAYLGIETLVYSKVRRCAIE